MPLYSELLAFCSSVATSLIFLVYTRLSLSGNILVYCDKFYITSSCAGLHFIYLPYWRWTLLPSLPRASLCSALCYTGAFTHLVPLLSVIRRVKAMKLHPYNSHNFCNVGGSIRVSIKNIEAGLLVLEDFNVPSNVQMWEIIQILSVFISLLVEEVILEKDIWWLNLIPRTSNTNANKCNCCCQAKEKEIGVWNDARSWTGLCCPTVITKLPSCR